MATTTASEIAGDWSNRHTINLARVEAGEVENVKSFLTDLEAKLTEMLAKGDLGPGKQAKLETIQKAAASAIGKSYGGITGHMQGTLEGIAETEAKAGGKLLNKQLGVDVFGPVLTENQWTAVANESLIFGHSSSDWWASQEADLRFKFAGQMQEGYSLGEDVDAMIRRVRGTKANGYTDGIMQTSKRNAEALVRSSVQTISNQARLKGFEQQGDIIKGIQWQSTLDGRTTSICKALSGLQWRLPDYEPIGHTKAFPGPTAHWNCRSSQVSVLRSWAELSGKAIKALDGATLQEKLQERLKKKGMAPDMAAKAVANAQSSMDGQVSAALDFQDWLKGKPDAFALDLLGPGRYAMWKAGKITTKDLTDQQNRPLTIAQLQAAIDGDGFPVETEGVEFLTGPEVAKYPSAAISDPEMAGNFAEDYEVEPVGYQNPDDEDEDQTSRQVILAEFEAGPTNDGSLGATFIKVAIDDETGDVHVLRNEKGEIIAAISWSQEGDVLTLENVGSVQTGGGKQAVKLLIQHAQDNGLTIELDSKEVAWPFYEKLGFEKDGEKSFKADDATQKAILAKLAGAATEAAPNQINQAEAASQIAAILANPKGQTLKAAALAKLQKSDPKMPPSDMLAMAEGIAQEKQAAASKASILSQAKKKLVAEEIPTAAQYKLLNSLPVEEQNAFLASVDEAKKALSAGSFPELEKAIEATGGKLTPDQLAKLEALAVDDKQYLKGKILHAEQDAAKQTLKDQYPNLAAVQADPEGAAQFAALPPDLKAEISDHLYQKQETGKAKIYIDAWQNSSDPLKKSAIAEAEHNASTPIDVMEMAESLLVQKKMTALADGVAGPKATKLKQAAFKKQTGYTGGFDDTGDIYEFLANEIGPSEAVELHDKVMAEAAAKQAAASKASILSQAKKKLAEGKDPTPAQQALIDTLTGEETIAFYASAKDAKVIEAAKQSGKITVVQGMDLTQPAKQLDAKKGLAALKKIEPLEGSDYEDFIIDFEDADIADYSVNQLNKDGYTATGMDEAETFATKPEADQAKVPNQIVTVKLADLITNQPWIRTADVEHYIKNSSTESSNPALLGKPPMVIKKDGNLFLFDGNHRANAWLLSGETEMPVLVYDLDAKANLVEASPAKQGKALEGVAKALMAKKPDPNLVATLKAKLGFDPTVGANNQLDVETVLAGWEQGGGKDLGEILADAKAEVKAAAKLASKTTTTTAPDLAAKNLDLYVPDPGTLTKLKDLSGSTKPILAEDPATGKQWVVKSGTNAEHLQNEAAADELYRIVGASVPGSAYTTGADGKPYKVAEFLEGAKTLGEWERTATAAEKQAIYAEIQDHFVMDALLGNWDVAGQGNDNLMVTAAGKAVRIDNGGALNYRAQGTKKTAAEWNPRVTELTTMRDPSVAAGRTADIFAGITQGEINNQIAAILAKRDELREATTASKGKAVAAMLANRIDYLEAQLPPAMKKPTGEAKQAAQATFAQIPKTIAKEIEKSKTTGVAIPVGSKHVEDLQALVWQEKSAGTDITRVHLTLTTEGSDAVKATLGNKIAIAPAIQTDGTGNAADSFINDTQAAFSAMGSTIKTHATDKEFNQGTVAVFKKAVDESKLQLKILKAKSSKTAEEKTQQAAIEHYLKFEGPMLDAMTKGGAIPWVDKFTYQPGQFSDDTATAAKPTIPTKEDFVISKGKNLVNNQVEFKNGEATHLGATTKAISVEQGVYHAEWPDGTTIKFIPRTDRTGGSPGTGRGIKGIALEGQVDIFIPGKADPTTVAQALEKLRSMGVDTTEASADYRELVWLKKTAHVNKLTFGKKWKNVEARATLPEQIQAARKLLETTTGKAIPKRGTAGYTADGVADPNQFHKSYTKVYRADLPPQEITQRHPELRVIHSVYGSIDNEIEKMMASGGELTPTQDRIRRGIFGGEGISAESDVASGGASYIFTRLRDIKTIAKQPTDLLVFKGTTLARADAVSHSGDVYGATEKIASRVSDLDKMANMASKEYSSNETVFKKGLSLIDEIDTINVTSETKRNNIIASYKKAGFAKLPDGRKIEDVVKLV